MSKPLEDIRKFIPDKKVKLLGLRGHLKASEKYVDVEFFYPKEKQKWVGSVPYEYRRLGLFLEKPVEIAKLVMLVYEAVRSENLRSWVRNEKEAWNVSHGGKTVTKPFFDKLLNMSWNCVDCKLPKNRNWARRIQDIKEMGYLLATHINLFCEDCKKNTTHILLLPMRKGKETGYEYISPELRKRIIKVLDSYDAYEGKVKSSSNLIPDHKFPEISWDAETKQQSLENLTDEEIKQKFQLLDNQRNLQKREVCRQVFQTGKMDTIFGIQYYHKGDGNWPKGTPKMGTEAEKGWEGSPWYDIERWRQSLNRDIKRWQAMEKEYEKLKKKLTRPKT